MKQGIIILFTLIFISGCSTLKTIDEHFKSESVRHSMKIESECQYEAIKYGQGDWEQEQRIYWNCLINKE